jgi:hypothetical protein
MNKEIREIKIESQIEYYFRLIKEKFKFFLKTLFIISILITVLYIGFYFLLFLIILLGVNYLYKSMKSN